MYSRYLSLGSSPDNRAAAEQIADKVYSHIKGLDGFVSVHFIISEDQTEYGSFSLWESKEQAEAGGATIQALVKEDLQAIASGPPVIKLYEVYKPKG